MLKDYISISVKSLGKRKTRTYLTMIGIFIGIAAVVSLIGLGEGLRNAITSQFGFLGTDVLSVQASGLNQGPPGVGVPNPLTDDLIEKIDRIQNVKAVFGRLITSAKIEFNDVQDIGFLGSMPTGDNRKVFETMVNLKAQQGRLLRENDGRRVILGADFAEDDRFGKAAKVGDTILISDIEFEVIGILEKKGSFIFDSSILMDDTTMLDTIREDDGTLNIIAVQVQDQSKIADTKADIEKLLRKERDVDLGDEDFSVETSESSLEQLNNTLFAVQLFLYIIAAISIIVGGIGIMNTMYTAVLERTKEIGIMKSIGAKNSTIFTLFFIESGLLGLVGGIIGVLLGLMLAYGFAALGRISLGSELIQADVSLTVIFSALIGAYVLGTFFGVLPAWRASKLNPVESLRRAR